MTILGACFPPNGPLYKMLDLATLNDGEHGIVFQEVVEFYARVVRLLKRASFLRDKQQRKLYYFECKVLVCTQLRSKVTEFET